MKHSTLLTISGWVTFAVSFIAQKEAYAAGLLVISAVYFTGSAILCKLEG